MKVSWWTKVKAYFRWDLQAVCDASVGKDEYNDYHDYPDAESEPWHFVLMKCHRCGKEFYI
jgi:hypothetical protein